MDDSEETEAMQEALHILETTQRERQTYCTERHQIIDRRIDRLERAIFGIAILLAGTLLGIIANLITTLLSKK